MVALIVGLGNPGEQYVKTRHNAGFLFVESLLSEIGEVFSYASKFKADAARFQHNGKIVHVLKPQTYMNKSGYSVAAYARYYDINVEEILVAHDELDLQPGVIRIKKSGGHGGHNGLRDIINHLSSPNFYRMRIGVGHPGDRRQVVNYVLDAPSKHDKAQISQAVLDGLGVMGDVFRAEYQQAMQCLHTK
ncbi:MAG: aminoacyl-tRNA hydrolase [Piscirickettsiaceae bacterium]|nr:MAG: aminoacyl-tRNA hydrolase [Piscirickettsiaceae bacterium]